MKRYRPRFRTKRGSKAHQNDGKNDHSFKHAEEYSIKTGYLSYSQSTNFKFISFSWMTKWINVGCRGILKPEDYPNMPDCDFDQFAATEFGSYMNRYRSTDGNGFLERVIGRTRLSIMKVFRHSLIWFILFTAFRDVFEVVNVYLLQRVMKQNLPKSTSAILGYILLAFTVCLVQLVDIFVDGHHHFYRHRIVCRIENLLFSFIFSRIVSKDYVEKSEWNLNGGKDESKKKKRGIAKFFDSDNRTDSMCSNVEDDLSVMNLALFDITEVAWGILKLVHLMTVPLKIIIVGTWLYSQVALTAVKGICFILLITFLMLLSECQSARMIKRYVHRMDLRIFKTQTILEDLRNLRLLRWIPLAIDSIINSRINELQICLKRTYLTAIGSWLGSSLPKMLALAVFLISIAESGVSLDPSFSIPLLHTLNYFIRPFKEIPSDISDHLETTVSCNRVESFIYRKELDCHIKTNYDALSKRKLVNGVRVQKRWYKQLFQSMFSHSSKRRSRHTSKVLHKLRHFDSTRDEWRPDDSMDKNDSRWRKNGSGHCEMGEVTTAEWTNLSIQDKNGESTPSINDRDGDVMCKENELESMSCKDYPFVLKLENATFSRGGKVSLSNISLTLEIAQVAMIIGPCGSGKSSLIQAIMGNCILCSGTCIVPPLNLSLPIGYVGQNPWISAGSVREIILFGHVYNEILYSHVVKIVELDVDFKSWDRGDLRRVDEGGQNLSTGQRVRISLARTIYNMKVAAYGDAFDVANNFEWSFRERFALYCLDDVFSVLDPSLCVRIFNRLFGPFGMLKDASTVLVVQPNFFGIVHGSFAENGQFFIYTMNDGSMELTSRSIAEYLETHGNISSRMSASGVSSCDYIYDLKESATCTSPLRNLDSGHDGSEHNGRMEWMTRMDDQMSCMENDEVDGMNGHHGSTAGRMEGQDAHSFHSVKKTHEMVHYFSIEERMSDSDSQLCSKMSSIDARRIDSDASFLLSCISPLNSEMSIYDVMSCEDTDVTSLQPQVMNGMHEWRPEGAKIPIMAKVDGEKTEDTKALVHRKYRSRVSQISTASAVMSERMESAQNDHSGMRSMEGMATEMGQHNDHSAHNDVHPHHSGHHSSIGENRQVGVKCKDFHHMNRGDEFIRIESPDYKMWSPENDEVIEMPKSEILLGEETFAETAEAIKERSINMRYIHQNVAETLEDDEEECVEKCARGAIKTENFAWYLKKVSLKLVVLLLIISTVAMTLDVGSEMVITQWTALGKKSTNSKETIVRPIHLENIIQIDIVDSGDENVGRKLNHLYAFTFLTSATIVLFLWRSLIEAQGTLNAAHRVYESALKGILNCSLSQLNHTPIGSINNRLSTDQSYVDYSIFRRFSQTSSTIIFVILTAISLCYLSVWVIPMMPILILLSYTLVFRNYIPMCMENMRATLQSRSSLVSVLSQTINGASVVRTSKREEYTMELFLTKLYTHQKTKFFSYAAGSWTIIRLRFIAYPLILINILMPIVPLIYRLIVYGIIDDAREKIVSPDVGLALTYSMKFAKLLKTTLSRMVELESEMCASQRLQELARMSPDYKVEDERIFVLKRKTTTKRPLSSLGERTGVTVINLCVDYDGVQNGEWDGQDEPMETVEHNDHPGDCNECSGDNGLAHSEVTSLIDKISPEDKIHRTSLQGINFRVEACQMIGIVGRTGAGKSTLLLALSGLLPFSGRILLDDCDIQDVEDVDECVGNIPHTPPLLAGWTVRDCVDPYKKYSDDEVWKALEACSIDGFVKSIAARSNGLPCEEGSEYANLYVGIKKSWESMCTDDSAVVVSDSYLQYFSLARLYLRREGLRLMLIDEAAYVENEMVPMHVLLKEHFSHCTTFIVAHHAESLTLCDRVLILDQGKLVGESKAPEIV